ncbi:MAG: hypothetical protein ABSF94_20170 [Steroidobacteraceae bacterium]|jgi:hypothetical protein
MASQNPYHAPMLNGFERMGGVPSSAQTAWYAQIVNAAGNAVREKQRQALAARRTSADKLTNVSRQGIQAGSGPADGPNPP